jgi:hypothetical protein
MNKQDFLKPNVVPEGKEAWLSYEDYLALERLFEAVGVPGPGKFGDTYTALYGFLVRTAGLTLPKDKAAIHFNAFTLLRRGYKIEEITEREYRELLRLMDGLEQPHKTDMELHDTGGHRDLYNYLTKTMGLPAQAGRGPVWYRAQALIEKHIQEEVG